MNQVRTQNCEIETPSSAACSPLFPKSYLGTEREEPVFFRDLYLDQIVAAITKGREQYDLLPFFYTPLADQDAITLRHQVFRDLENEELLGHISRFSRRLATMRACLVQSEKLRHEYQSRAWFLDAVEVYCSAVSELNDRLGACELQSNVLVTFRRWLADYLRSSSFVALASETASVKAELHHVQYCVLIRGGGFKVRKYDGETDYSSEVEAVFRKFKQGDVKGYLSTFSERPEMNHIEGKILDFVALLYSDEFACLDAYCARHKNYLDETIKIFDREIQFYLAYLEHATAFARVGLHFCYPEITQQKGDIYSRDAFDLALAWKLLGEKAAVVCNDFDLQGGERVLIVTGPNQGGKTTFARMFGQLHYLARLGCPVPGTAARLFLSDNVFTHFEREEDIETRRGKLEDDLVRVREILDHLTASSIIVVNEAFTSTTVADALYLSTHVLERLCNHDALCVWVTFLDELASLNEKTVSMVAMVEPDNPAGRTFKVVRRPADGLAYAMALAEKYRLTYDRLKERLQP